MPTDPNYKKIEVSQIINESAYSSQPSIHISQFMLEVLYGNMFKPIHIAQLINEIAFGNMFRSVQISQNMFEVAYQIIPGKIYTRGVRFAT